ncbi:hypothetical protein [Microbispora sitophila]|uniref:hypothetical protein n=1 Tax=Microbispora sitophila TaxID=2771537 RepID=UPI0021F74B60|nr:hypothetical protein [Microbispora sitophila]
MTLGEHRVSLFEPPESHQGIAQQQAALHAVIFLTQTVQQPYHLLEVLSPPGAGGGAGQQDGIRRARDL